MEMSKNKKLLCSNPKKTYNCLHKCSHSTLGHDLTAECYKNCDYEGYDGWCKPAEEEEGEENEKKSETKPSSPSQTPL
jgi:hypothetical protein